MEAESVPVVAPWVVETDSAPGYTGTGHLRFNGNTDAGGPANGRMRFYFTVDRPGDYRLVMRSRKINDEEGHLGKYVFFVCLCICQRLSHPFVLPTKHDSDCYTKLVGHSGYQGTDVKTFMRGALSNRVWHYDTRFDLDHTPTTPIYTLNNVGTVYEFQLSGRSRNFFIDRIVLYHTNTVTHAFATNNARAESTRNGVVEALPTSNFTQFTLTTAGTNMDAPVGQLRNGTTIDLATANGGGLSVIAEIEGSESTVVKFYYGDNVVWRESGAPYAMRGNSGDDMNPVPYLATPGDKTVLVQAFLNGILQDERQLNFVIENSAPTAGPTVAPTMSPTLAPVTDAPTSRPTTASPTLAPVTASPTQTRSPTKSPTILLLPEVPLELGESQAAAAVSQAGTAPRCVLGSILALAWLVL